jgi:hypothetical protein
MEEEEEGREDRQEDNREEYLVSAAVSVLSRLSPSDRGVVGQLSQIHPFL